MSRVIATLVAAALLVAACGGPGASVIGTIGPTDPQGSAPCTTLPAPPEGLEGWTPPATAPTVIPFIINASGELVCGSNRLLFTIIDPKTNAPIGAPDRFAKVAIYNLGRDAKTPIATLDGTFIWAIENERGIYVSNVTFPDAGRYGAEFSTGTAGGDSVTLRLTFDVQPSSAIVKVGDKAPASKTPTLADVGGDATKISTDQAPEPALYETSVDQALAGHKPFVLIFATPKFCTSQQCGPTLERLKPFLAKYPTVTFINIEPYKLELVDGILEPVLDAQNYPVAATTTDEWGIVTEPNVYVVDRDGVVRANFELIFSDAELTAALDAIK